MGSIAGREVSRVQQDDGLRGVVAVDGPAGTGKSTVARRLAASLGARYLDTGAMYRAATLGVLRAGVDPTESTAVSEVVAQCHIEVGTDPDIFRVLLDGEDVSREIRGPAVTLAVSPVSAVSPVRELLVAEQRRIIVDATAAGGGIVVEGRDIGTVVVPDAPLKVFLTATAAQRAARRAAQDGVDDVAEIRRAVERRDRFDSSRAMSPMCAAADAVELDTTALDVDAVLGKLHELAVVRGLVVLAARGRT
ncbi:MAG: (d)CMP kinase [Pseudonocardiales bacterium]|nr:(d)CMP kinase [Pseudonocardiales bacterium]MBV9729464.1 (d)CMP kinase [Pseudonocardiales bacterium]